MKKMIVLIGLLAGTGALGAHAATPAHPMKPEGKPKVVITGKSNGEDLKTPPFSCTITVSGSVSAGFGSISASCSATEANCDLATYAASNCLSSVLRSLKARLK
jgi:hypothetical protein